MPEDKEPDELDLMLERARRKMDAGRDELLAGIRRSFEAGRKPTRIARHARWSERYIAKLRDGEAAPEHPPAYAAAR
jgi:hypothetical protein